MSLQLHRNKFSPETFQSHHILLYICASGDLYTKITVPVFSSASHLFLDCFPQLWGSNMNNYIKLAKIHKSKPQKKNKMYTVRALTCCLPLKYVEPGNVQHVAHQGYPVHVQPHLLQAINHRDLP